jgi:hypothetical protein
MRDWTEIHDLIDQGRVAAAEDELFDGFDDLFLSGDFGAADALLPTLDVGRLDPAMLVAVLCVTHVAQGLLPNYPALHECVRLRLLALVPERADSLMRGFEVRDKTPHQAP